MTGMHAAFLLVSICLFVLSAVPPVPYGVSLARLGLAFLAAALLV